MTTAPRATPIIDNLQRQAVAEATSDLISRLAIRASEQATRENRTGDVQRVTEIYLDLCREAGEPRDKPE